MDVFALYPHTLRSVVRRREGGPVTSQDSHDSDTSPGPSAHAAESTGPSSGFDLFEVWKEYERIAMHFNDLLIRLRTQSLAAVAAFATIAGVLLKSESIGRELRWGTLAAVFAVLALLWLAIWVFDFTYYNRLLLGAVRSLLAIEEASKSGTRLAALSLSIDIEAAVRRGDSVLTLEYWARAKGRWVFYTVVFAVLVSGVIVSVRALGGAAGELHVISGETNSAPSNTPLQPVAPVKK